MLEINGLSVAKGIAIGHAYILNKKNNDCKRIGIFDANSEIERVYEAIINVTNKIRHQLTEIEPSQDEKLFEKYTFMLSILEGKKFFALIKKNIRKEGSCAEEAILGVVDNYEKFHHKVDCPHKGDNIRYYRMMLQKLFVYLEQKNKVSLKDINYKTILVADKITIDNVGLIDGEKVIGYVTEKGGKTSHASLMAKVLNMPAVVKVDGLVSKVCNGDTIILDGNEGKVFVNPEQDVLKYYIEKRKQIKQAKKAKNKYYHEKAKTRDGKIITIDANVNSYLQIDKAVDNGADGIGLFRTESIFLNENRLLSEKEQFEEYKKAVLKAGDRSVTFRTLDIGGDKQLRGVHSFDEENPHLGFRGIRVSLQLKEIFVTQLRALLRASYYGNVRIMFPFVSCTSELEDALIIMESTKKMLVSEGILFGEIKVGVMIEVPSAAILVDALAKKVDFISIGTNDLIQYTLGADRDNAAVSHVYSEYNPAVLRLIDMIIKGVRGLDVDVSLCGDMATNTYLLPLLVAMGIKSFSVPSSMISNVYETIIKIDTRELEHLKKALTSTCHMKVEKFLKRS